MTKLLICVARWGNCGGGEGGIKIQSQLPNNSLIGQRHDATALIKFAHIHKQTNALIRGG